jgi:hypothetical protein
LNALVVAFAAVSFLLSLVAATLAGVAYLNARAAGQLQLPAVAQLRNAVDAVERAQTGLRAEWTSTLASLDAAMEALDERSGILERKRRTAQGAADRAKQLQEQAEPEDPILAAYRKARAMGLDV